MHSQEFMFPAVPRWWGESSAASPFQTLPLPPRAPSQLSAFRASVRLSQLQFLATPVSGRLPAALSCAKYVLYVRWWSVGVSLRPRPWHWEHHVLRPCCVEESPSAWQSAPRYHHTPRHHCRRCCCSCCPGHQTNPTRKYWRTTTDDVATSTRNCYTRHGHTTEYQNQQKSESEHVTKTKKYRHVCGRSTRKVRCSTRNRSISHNCPISEKVISSQG